MLLGVHAARMDVATGTSRGRAPRPHCAWYADVLLTLTQDAAMERAGG